MAQEFVQGWTERINYTIEADGSAVNLATMTVALLLWDKNGTAVSTTGTVGIENASTGLVYYDPDSSVLTRARSPLYVRWKVTDNGGQAAFFPNEAPDLWYVRER